MDKNRLPDEIPRGLASVPRPLRIETAISILWTLWHLKILCIIAGHP